MSDLEMPHVTPAVLPARPAESSKPLFTPVTLDGLAAQVDGLTSQIQASQTQITDNYNTMANLATIINNNGNDLDTVTTQATQNTAQLADINSTLATLKAQINTISSEVNNLSGLLNTFMANYEKHTHAVQSYWVEANLEPYNYIVPVQGYAGDLVGYENQPPLALHDTFVTLAPKPLPPS